MCEALRVPFGCAAVPTVQWGDLEAVVGQLAAQRPVVIRNWPLLRPIGKQTVRVLQRCLCPVSGFGVDDILSEQSQDSVLVVFVLSTITPLIDHFFPHLTTR